MSKRHTNFLLVALLSILSLFVLFSCDSSGTKPSNDPATEDPIEDPDPAVDPNPTEDPDPVEEPDPTENPEPEDQGLPEVLSGEFSISENKKVRFTRGNLYCIIADGNPTWNIEANQYDFRTWSEQNSVINGTSGTTEANNVGLFYWSKDVTKTYPQNYDESQTNTSSDTFAIAKTSGHDCVIPGYDVLTSAEWVYLLKTRSSASSKHGLATITTPQGAQVTGCVFLPDDWTLPSGVSFTPGVVESEPSGYAANQYTSVNWTEMENAGAVFLPAPGDRSGLSLRYVGSDGCYWSSTPASGLKNMANYLYFAFRDGVKEVSAEKSRSRQYGIPVRLVKRGE